MKKIAFVLCMLLLATTIFAEKVAIDTPYKDKTVTLDIPSDYASLKALTVQLATLYWGERYDREQSQADVAKLQKTVDDQNTSITNLKNQLLKTQDLLDVANKVTPFQFTMLYGGFYFVAQNQIIPSIGAGVLFFDKVSAYVTYSLVDKLGLYVGVKF